MWLLWKSELRRVGGSYYSLVRPVAVTQLTEPINSTGDYTEGVVSSSSNCAVWYSEVGRYLPEYTNYIATTGWLHITISKFWALRYTVCHIPASTMQISYYYNTIIIYNEHLIYMFITVRQLSVYSSACYVSILVLHKNIRIHPETSWHFVGNLFHYSFYTFNISTSCYYYLISLSEPRVFDKNFCCVPSWFNAACQLWYNQQWWANYVVFQLKD